MSQKAITCHSTDTVDCWQPTIRDDERPSIVDRTCPFISSKESKFYARTKKSIYLNVGATSFQISKYERKSDERKYDRV